MERCPNCGARYKGGRECHRCGMELSRLLHIESQAKRWEQVAVKRLAAGDREGAEVAVARSLALQRRPLALVLRAFVRQGGAE
ncbi:hypothetical protein [Nitrosococcus wardiae]|uniref:Uncharacterized protein n=1 Tax=Nitrosococcus wardiae TaxID=1814290 RepID=A0A4P7BZI2_9GAMM|nr:hypothetical protein [Nitrosococcus wardiae]QBQ54767.1 hypothetical protein E3U44_09795 [Nitrosococcus wardiae]